MKFSSSSIRTSERGRRDSFWGALDFVLSFLLCAGVVIGACIALGWLLLLSSPQLNAQAAWLAARVWG